MLSKSTFIERLLIFYIQAWMNYDRMCTFWMQFLRQRAIKPEQRMMMLQVFKVQFSTRWDRQGSGPGLEDAETEKVDQGPNLQVSQSKVKPKTRPRRLRFRISDQSFS